MYSVAFCALTWPLIRQFPTRLFGDTGDGLQNLWNLWWVREALVNRGVLPWFTPLLHHPSGTSLAGHALSPLNGLIGILLQTVLHLEQSYNVIVLLGFIGGGLAAFWLAWDVTRSWFGALVAGYVYTFSQYHFAHAEGHLELLSMQWVPLFLLVWRRFLARGGVRRALASAFLLLLLLLCTPYFLFQAVLAGGLMTAWRAWVRRDAFFALRGGRFRSTLVFLVATVATSGVLVLALLLVNRHDPLLCSHDPEAFSLDALAPFVPGGHWRFHVLTEPYWARLPGNIHESSVYVGWSVIALALLGLGRRRRQRAMFFWLFFAVIAYLVALGPSLQIAGKTAWKGPMPYDVLTRAFPPLRMSGVPVRLTGLLVLALSVAAAGGVRTLISRRGLAPAIALAMLLAFALVECLPRPMPATELTMPGYVRTLAGRAQSEGSVLDIADENEGFAMYYQTAHHKPLAFGYLSRYPTSVLNDYLDKRAMIAEGQFGRLRAVFDVRYVVSRKPIPEGETWSVRPLYQGADGSLSQLSLKQRTPGEVRFPAKGNATCHGLRGSLHEWMDRRMGGNSGTRFSRIARIGSPEERLEDLAYRRAAPREAGRVGIPENARPLRRVGVRGDCGVLVAAAAQLPCRDRSRERLPTRYHLDGSRLRAISLVLRQLRIGEQPSEIREQRECGRTRLTPSLWVRSALFTGLLFAPRFSVRVAGVPVLLEQAPFRGLARPGQGL